MPWIVQTPLPAQLGEICAICDREPAVTTVLAETENVEATVIVISLVERLSMRVPCGPRCSRRFKLIRKLIYGFALVPWILLTALALLPHPAALWASEHPANLVLAAGVVSCVGLPLFYFQWWLRRAVRPICSGKTFVTLAVRHEGFARRLPRSSGTVIEKVWWAG